MYDPCTQVCEKYPEWLAAHKSHLSEKDYQNYGMQYQIFQRVLAVYDVEPDNFPRYDAAAAVATHKTNDFLLPLPSSTTVVIYAIHMICVLVPLPLFCP
jgi:hypothetical protein